MPEHYIVRLTTNSGITDYYIVDAPTPFMALSIMNSRQWVKQVHAVRPYDDQRPHKTWSGLKFDEGAFVEVKTVDVYGFTGRELHPSKKMVGCLGKVLGHSGRAYTEGYDYDWVDFFIVRLTTPPPGYDQYVEFADFELDYAVVPQPATVESEPATIAVAAPTQPEPKGDSTMTTPRNPQHVMMAKLIDLGYTVTNVYNDDSVNMTNDDIMVFVLPDGRVKPPRTASTMTAQAELAEAGIELDGSPGVTSDRYYADTHGDEEFPGYFVFDSLDTNSVCCGPFANMEIAQRNADKLNRANVFPQGLRPHMIQHALEMTKDPEAVEPT